MTGEGGEMPVSDEDDAASDRALRDGVHAALCDALAGKAMVTKLVALVEVIEESGDRVVWSLASDGMRSWETLGLLKFGEQIEAAEMVALRMSDDEN